MGKTVRRLWPLALLAVVMGAALLFRPGRGVSASIALFCSATGYAQGGQSDTLTIRTDSQPACTLQVPVNDPDLRAELAQSDLTAVIGVQMALEIPPAVVRQQHLDPEQFRVFDQLATGRWDQYLILQDVFYR